jgi:hypothetical protein
MVEWRPQVCQVGGAAGNLKGARDPGSHRHASMDDAPPKQLLFIPIVIALVVIMISYFL